MVLAFISGVPSSASGASTVPASVAGPACTPHYHDDLHAVHLGRDPWDVERRDWRTFRIDRISPRLPTGPRFTARPLPADDVAAYVSRRASAVAWRHHASVVVHAPAAAIAERIPPAAGSVEARDGRSCLFHTGADSLDTIAVHLSLLGVDFEVTDPPELVDRIGELARRYAQAVSIKPNLPSTSDQPIATF